LYKVLFVYVYITTEITGHHRETTPDTIALKL